MKTFFNFKKYQTPLLTSFLGITLIFLSLLLFINSFSNKYLPNTSIDNTHISGLTPKEAINKLEKENRKIPSITVNLITKDKLEATTSAQLKPYFDYSSITKETLNNQKNKLSKLPLSLKELFSPTTNMSKIKVNNLLIVNYINKLNEKIAIKGENPSISLKISNNENSLVVFKGKIGEKINTKETKENLIKKLNEQLLLNNNLATVEATLIPTNSEITDEKVEKAINRAKKFVGKELEFKADNKTYYIDDKTLISFINPAQGYKEKEIDELLNKWSKEIDRQPQDAEFKYNQETLEVSIFIPHKNGLKLNKQKTKQLILKTLHQIEENKDFLNIQHLLIKRTPPNKTLEKTNNLGIKEQIGFGESYYYHSIINRVHNVSITANRISLTIVPPQQEFSFNKALGEVSARTGYRSAYVISGGKTVLGDGGGVCQVSSTLFRTVLDAGLEVTKRLQHSYRVSYYELNSQPGFDATVYAGNVDFRFINNTPNYILIYTHTEPENRYMNIEIYGTNDGRTTEIKDYKTWGYRRPPAPQYYPTNTLPTGVTRQVDWSVSGIKTEFTHVIKNKQGNIINTKKYYSNYKPWSAKYMIGI